MLNSKTIAFRDGSYGIIEYDSQLSKVVMYSKTSVCKDLSSLNTLLVACDMASIDTMLEKSAMPDIPSNITEQGLVNFGQWLFSQYALFTINHAVCIINDNEESVLNEWLIAFKHIYQEVWTNFSSALPKIAAHIKEQYKPDAHQIEVDELLIKRNCIPTHSAILDKGSPFHIHAGVNNANTFLEWLNMRRSEVIRQRQRILQHESPISNEMFEWYVGGFNAIEKVISHLNSSTTKH